MTDTLALKNWWLQEFSATQMGQGIDYLSRDGKFAVQVKRATAGSRGLYAASLEMAIYLQKNPAIERLCVVLDETRMSVQRLQDEWKAVTSALHPQVSQRLALIVVEDQKTWSTPDDPTVQKIAEVFQQKEQSNKQTPSQRFQNHPGTKGLEVVKVLLQRWLLKQGPIPLGELAAAIGCSYPTLRRALDKSTLHNSLEFTTNRSVQLKVFPHEAWRELLALAPTTRGSLRFCDRSGEKLHPERLLTRLRKMKPTALAIGGVLAARHWHADFDLHGIPRLDLIYHSPDGKIDLQFFKKLDPALELADSLQEPACLVVHPLLRKNALFSMNGESSIPWADPVETALDLADLSLTAQAQQMLTHLRTEVRL